MQWPDPMQSLREEAIRVSLPSPDTRTEKRRTEIGCRCCQAGAVPGCAQRARADSAAANASSVPGEHRQCCHIPGKL